MTGVELPMCNRTAARLASKNQCCIFRPFHIEPRETLSPLDRRLDIDAVTIPRMIKVLSEEFDPAGRRLLFCESANLRLWPCRWVGLNCRISQEIHWTSKDTALPRAQRIVLALCQRTNFRTRCYLWSFYFVRFGSLADMCAAKSHVRFTPKSGHQELQTGARDMRVI
jgi:hypothetical protein